MTGISWEKYKSQLRKVYFGDSGVLGRDSVAADDFWIFFNKYQSVMTKKGVTVDMKLAEEGPSPHQTALNSLKLPLHYSKYFKQSNDFNLGKPERYALKIVPKYVITEFEYILHCYVEFLQREKVMKLKKLRKAQQALPIFHFKEEIIRTVRDHQVVILAGDTGCGKSTQLPQFLLANGYTKIACTQPRRIACISLAKRVAYETLNEFGSQIAYQIRFERTKSTRTRMLFLTEGLLLRQITGDPLLSMYDVIILDEVHERHLHGDFLLGILKDLLTKRKDLKMICMSATINIDLFSNYFQGKAPVICVPGRLYPIQLHYRPLNDKETKSEKIDASPYLRLVQMIDKKFPSTERGDVLVFMSGIQEMTAISDAIAPYAEESRRWIVLMLHSTLSIEEQDKVFDIAPEGVRKLILSTNIAETSVTIDGVRFVIDSGKVKEMKYDSGSRMHRLTEIWVSKASAEQRKGRAGRTGPGICYRLYSEGDFSKFDDYTTSEIHRVSLESLVLQMFHLGLPNPRRFDFIESPSAESLEEAIDSLKCQGAVSEIEELTSLGKILVNLPVDVPVGKMLIMGCLFRQSEAVLTVAAAVSVQNVFTAKSYRDLDCCNLRKNLMSDHGDPFALLKVYREWLEVKQSGENTRRWCTKRGIEEQRLYEITKLRNQFKELLEQSELIERRSFALSSSERRIRFGEMKHLKDLKRKFQTEQKKKKVLKVNALEAVAMDENLQDKESLTDVHAVEFQLKHTATELDARLRDTEMSYATVFVLKIIIASGLYPQYGILDQHNSYRPGGDQMVHTRVKPFMILHPNSCLGQDPEVLRVETDAMGRSCVHQLIFYGLLLETNKPFVVNSLRVPAFHTALMCSRSIDTNRDCSKIACDGWIEFTTDNCAMAQMLLFEAVSLRQMLSECLQRKLDGDNYNNEHLGDKILKFLQMELLYSMRRLLTADQQAMYVGASQYRKVTLPEAIMNKFKATVTDNMEKGGVNLTEFLTYGCLLDKADSNVESEFYLTVNWVCPSCQVRFLVSPIERIDHLNTCGKAITDGGETSSDGQSSEAEKKTIMLSSDNADDPLKRSYYCNECACEVFGTPVEILKHKRSHS